MGSRAYLGLSLISSISAQGFGWKFGDFRA